jgi:hypothetical protein
MNNGRQYWMLAVSFCAAGALACSGKDNLNGGNQGTGGRKAAPDGGKAAVDGGKAAVDGANTVVGSQLSDYVATWDGYAEAYSFSPDGSDRVRMTIGANGQGTLEVGNEPMLLPPTDPNLGYPPEITDNSGMYEGFLYPTHAAAISANRIQLGIDSFDVYTAWCALQTPVLVNAFLLPDGGTQRFYGCLPNWGTGPNSAPDGGPDAGLGCALTPPDGGAIVPVDCDKITLCQIGAGACSCSASSCTSRSVPSGTPPNQYPTELDAALDGTGRTLTGTLALPNGIGRITVHLTKQ